MMGLILLNLQSNQEIKLEKDNPFVIGRGFVTGCTDKRVSRSHGRITYREDGKVSFLALHSNPCFFTRKGTPPVLQLNKNEEEVLNEGDCLGLLPNSYWYQITSKSGLKTKKTNNLKSSQRNVPKTETIPKEELMQLLERNKKSPTHKRSAPEDNIDSPPPKNVCHEVPAPSCSGENTKTVIPDHLKGTCKLPLWRYEIKGQKNLAQKYPYNTTDLVKSNNDQVTGAQLTLLESIAGLQSSLAAASTVKTKDKSPDEKKGCEGDSNAAANTSNSKFGRPFCQYGADCYRKNSQHKLEYSHPGDEDYVEYEKRPLCMYGASCYRKNLLHRRQFRHVSSQDPQTSQASDASASVDLAEAPDAPVSTVDSAEASNVPVATVDSAGTPDAPVATFESTEGPEAPSAAVDSTPAPVDPATSTAFLIAPTAPAAYTPGVSSKSSSKAKGKNLKKERRIKREPKERPKAKPKDHHKRKRHAEKDRSPRSCRLSVTVSSRPNQKRKRTSQAGVTNFTSFYSSDVSFDDVYCSSDPFSDDYSSDDYLPSTGSDDFDDLEYYGKDYFRDYYF